MNRGILTLYPRKVPCVDLKLKMTQTFSFLTHKLRSKNEVRFCARGIWKKN